MTLNTIMKMTHLSNDFKNEFKTLKDIGYGDLNYDAMWKWSGILNVFNTLLKDRQNLKAIDIGGGLSPLHYILSNNHKITNVEKNFKGNWFPTNSEGLYIGNTGVTFNRDNIEYVEEDFRAYITRQPDNSVDVFYDGCSLIHFDHNNTFKKKNDGVAYVAQQIKRVLKDGGIYITCTDILHPLVGKITEHKYNEGEWLYMENLFNIYTEFGLMPVDKPDFKMEDFFMNRENIFYNAKHCPTHRRQTPNYALKKDLPDYHCLTHLHKGNLLAICRMVFIK